MSQVLEEIRAEREYQDEQWGTEFVMSLSWVRVLLPAFGELK